MKSLPEDVVRQSTRKSTILILSTGFKQATLYKFKSALQDASKADLKKQGEAGEAGETGGEKLFHPFGCT